MLFIGFGFKSVLFLFMAVILNIDTSTDVCSVALSAEGMILSHREEFDTRDHSSLLSGYIKSCLDDAAGKGLKIDAIAVTLGPGSYTGLRIGLSEAKGLAYALEVPLIGLCSLKVIAVGAMFAPVDIITPDTIFIPMIDARRDEVYTAVYDMSLNELIAPQSLILESESFADVISTGRPIVLCGNGSDKAMQLIAPAQNVAQLHGITPLAVNMVAPAEMAYKNGDFIDTAYSVPQYLKEYRAVKPKSPFAKGE